MDIVIKIAYIVLVIFDLVMLCVNFNQVAKSQGELVMDYSPLSQIMLMSFVMAVYIGIRG